MMRIELLVQSVQAHVREALQGLLLLILGREVGTIVRRADFQRRVGLGVDLVWTGRRILQSLMRYQSLRLDILVAIH